MTNSIRQNIITDLKTALLTINPSTTLESPFSYNTTIAAITEWDISEDEELDIDETNRIIDIKDLTNNFSHSAHQQDENVLSLLLTFFDNTIEAIRAFEADLMIFLKFNQDFNSNVESIDFTSIPSQIEESHTEQKFFFYRINLDIIFNTEIWNPYS